MSLERLQASEPTAPTGSLRLAVGPQQASLGLEWPVLRGEDPPGPTGDPPQDGRPPPGSLMGVYENQPAQRTGMHWVSTIGIYIHIHNI